MHIVGYLIIFVCATLGFYCTEKYQENPIHDIWYAASALCIWATIMGAIIVGYYK
jgi:flagellar motor component MotA